jgi:hypothetical protein
MVSTHGLFVLGDGMQLTLFQLIDKVVGNLLELFRVNGKEALQLLNLLLETSIDNRA